MADNILLPVEPYPEQSFRIELDGVPTTFRFYWSVWNDNIKAIANETDDDAFVHQGCWYMDISTDVFSVNGITLTQGADLLEPFAQSSLGGIFVVNLLSNPSELTFDSMGDNHRVLYVIKQNLATFYDEIGYA